MDTIDFGEFFDSKYKNVNGLGIGAVGVITDKQIVVRVNGDGIDKKTGKIVAGLGRHSINFSEILTEIYDLPEGLDKTYESNYRALQQMTDDEKKIKQEVIRIDFANSSSNNTMVIYMPKLKKITSAQLYEIEQLLYSLQDISASLSRPIYVACGSEEDNIDVEDFNIEQIISFLERFVDDSCYQTVEDKNIIGSKLEKSAVLV